MATFNFHCPHCEQAIEADEEAEGKVANCPSCNEEIVIAREIENTSPDQKMEQLKPDKIVYAKNNNLKERLMKEYKVLTQKDKWFSGKFDPNNLEMAINAYAQQGWRVVSVATATFPGLMTNHREEMVVILERDK